MQYNLQNQHKTFPNTINDTFTYLLNMHQKSIWKRNGEFGHDKTQNRTATNKGNLARSSNLNYSKKIIET